MAKKKEKPTKNYSQNTTHKTKGWAIYASDGWTVPEWNLIIKDVNPDDTGVYECAVSSREKYKRLVMLRVIGTYLLINMLSWQTLHDGCH
jgi:hypothetical protein